VNWRLVLIVTFAFFAIRGWVASPLKGLVGAMEKLAQGDLTVAVECEGRRDEIGAIANAVQVFKDAAIAKVRLEGETVEQRRAVEALRTGNEAERAALAEQQALVVQSLAEGLSKLSDGDLVFRQGQQHEAHRVSVGALRQAQDRQQRRHLVSR